MHTGVPTARVLGYLKCFVFYIWCVYVFVCFTFVSWIYYLIRLSIFYSHTQHELGVPTARSLVYMFFFIFDVCIVRFLYVFGLII